MTEIDAGALAARHPEIFTRSARKRLLAWGAVAGTTLYLVYAWWFFAVGQVFASADWDIAGTYLADWVSYEVRPDIEFHDAYLDISYPRYGPLGANPDPDWVTSRTAMVERTIARDEANAADDDSDAGTGFLGTLQPAAPAKEENGFLGPIDTGGGGPSASAENAPDTVREEQVVETTVRLSPTASVSIVPGRVTLVRGDETVVLDIVRDKSVEPRSALPAWVEQRRPGGKVTARFGLAGRAEIENDEAKLRRRFLGWENFVFDTNSPFWGKSFSEVAALIVSGPRIKPEMSNLALAWDNVLNNAEWQHGDVWLKLMQTIVMAFAGTVLATLVAFPLSFLAARNIMPNRFLNHLAKRFFDFLRSVDMLIWALFFTRAFGPGPLAGISAIFFTDTGTFGKLYSESLENIDDRQREGVRSLGASPVVVQRFGVLPQVLPLFLSQSLYFWESNTRSATIIGAVGAGGIGLKLWEAMRTNQDWENVFYMVILILIVVFVFDTISGALRRRLMRQETMI